MLLPNLRFFFFQSRKDSVAENIQSFRDVFAMFDVNKDGQISVTELAKVMQALSMKVDQVKF